MRNVVLVPALAAVFFAASPASAQSISYDANPTTAFTYGAGNSYTPANATVLTQGDNELAVRFHEAGTPAPASGGDGIYNFALGTNVSFDFSIVGDTSGASLLLTNLLTGQTASLNPLSLGDANGGLPGFQNSEQLGFGFLNNSGPFAGCCGNLGFNANVDNTYRLDLIAGGNTVTSYAVLGAGAPAVPEPATWAMMLLGFGGIGFQLRRQGRRPLTQMA